MTYMNHELFSASFRYALECENSFHARMSMQAPKAQEIPSDVS